MEVIKFKVDIPVPLENEVKGSYINWGVNNLYPNWLLDLYTNSSLHKNIINLKTNKIVGEGLFLKEGEEFNLTPNPSYSFNSLTEYIVKDYILFNFFAIEVTYNKLGQPLEYRHVPAHQLRMNKDKSKFWVCDDWFKNSKNLLTFDRWKKGEKSLETKIFYFEKRTPSVMNVYPAQDYSGALKSILIDTEIDMFNLNNIQNHFSPTSIVTFFNGITDPAKKAEFVKKIQQNYTGTDGKKLIIDFADASMGVAGAKSSEVTNISPNSWDTMFEKTMDSVTKKICVGHSINAILAGASSDTNALSQSTELKNAYKIFYIDYVNVVRTQVEEALNDLLSERKDYKEIEMYSQAAFFEDEISESLSEKVMTINEVREKMGLTSINGGDVLIGSSLAVTEVETPEVPTEQFNDERGNKTELSDEDYDKIKELGFDSSEFEIISEDEFKVTSLAFAREVELHFDNESDIAQYLIDNDVDGKTVAEIKSMIRKDLGLTLTNKELTAMLDNLTKSKVINVEIDTDGKVKVTPIPVEDIREVSVVYQYAKRPEIDGAELLDTSRAFCKKMINNVRYYTREDVQSMTTIFGYDIFKYAGGFYHNPNTGDTTPFCRHFWKMIRVAKKKGNN